ncbi:MAG: T9SS type A sorting domain-containing protein [Chloroflexota bacterium]
MKTLVNSLNCRPAAWALALCVCTLFIAASSLAFSQISFEKIWEVPTPTFPIDPCFSKDGRFIYGASETNILKFDAQSGQFLGFMDRSAFPKMYKTEELAISPKGNYLLTHDGSTGLYLWDTKTDKAVRFIYQTGAGLVMTPDERYHIYEIAESHKPNTPPASENSNIYIYDLQLDSIIKKIPAWGHNSLLALSSDGKYLATVAYKNESKSTSPDSVKPRQKVLLWDTETWIPEVIDSLLYGKGADLNSGWDIRFSEDNKYLYWRTQNYKLNKIYNIETRKVIAVSPSPRDCYRIIFLPDSQSYGFCYPEMEVFDLKTNASKGKVDFQFYSWATYPGKGLLVGYDFSKGALFKFHPSGITDEKETSVFKANYKDSKLYLELSEKINVSSKISIYDISGKEILRWNEKNSTIKHIEIPVSLIPGVYLVGLEIDSKQYTQKIEVAR